MSLCPEVSDVGYQPITSTFSSTAPWLSSSSAAPAASAHVRPLLTVQATKALVVHVMAFAGQQQMQSTVAEAMLQGRYLASLAILERLCALISLRAVRKNA
jgi:hypothetical protein